MPKERQDKSELKQLNVELPQDLVDEAKAWAKVRMESLSKVVADALKRHMKWPPPLPADHPLPADDTQATAPEPTAPEPAELKPLKPLKMPKGMKPKAKK